MKKISIRAIETKHFNEPYEISACKVGSDAVESIELSGDVEIKLISKVGSVCNGYRIKYEIQSPPEYKGYRFELHETIDTKACLESRGISYDIYKVWFNDL